MTIPAFTLPAPTTVVPQWQPIWANFVGFGANPGIATELNTIITALNAIPAGPASLFDHFANASTSGTGIVALYSDTLVANQLANNGDKIHAMYAGSTSVTNTGTRDWSVQFGGTTIFDSSTVGSSNSQAWQVVVDLIRQTSAIVRCVTTILVAKPTAPFGVLFQNVQIATVSGLTLSNPQVLSISGQASAAGNDITATQGYVQFIPA